MNDIELIDEIVRRADEYHKQKEKEFAMKELEKIKDEIQHERSQHSGEGKYTYTVGLKVAIDFIDNHIAELKGE